MNYVPHNDSNNYVLFALIQFLKLKTPLSYTSFILDLSKNVIGFEKNITTIFLGFFDRKRNIKSVIIPDTVKYMSSNSFACCENLEHVVIPEGVKSINGYAFFKCISLKSIIIPETVKAIGMGAFKNCISLKKIIIPDSVKAIGYHAFFYCKSLEEIVIRESNISFEYIGIPSHTKITIKK